MNKLRDSTLLFLVKKSQLGGITDICLAMKKRGFGMNRWNGVGGKVEDNDKSVKAAARRETREEIGVTAKKLNKVAELSFFFLNNIDWNQTVHVYFCELWESKPQESEEMRPKWFFPDNLPYKAMWPDDVYWLPKVLEGYLVKGEFEFGEGDVIKRKTVEIVDKF